MALGSSSVVQGLVSSITGNVNKAYVLFHQPVKNADNENKESVAASGLAGLSNALTKAADVAGNRTGFSSVMGVDTNLAALSNGADYIPVQVQYNPSSISFSGTGSGTKVEETVGGNNNKSYTSYESPARIIMRVDLIFDDTHSTDAFMAEGSVLSASGLAQEGTRRIGQAVKEGSVTGLLHKTYSVQDISELFVAAMPELYSRYVGFVWNKMVFWGELTSADVEFTMFNKSGNPIRSKVSLTIEQETEGSSRMQKAWEKAFKELVKET